MEKTKIRMQNGERRMGNEEMQKGEYRKENAERRMQRFTLEEAFSSTLF